MDVFIRNALGSKPGHAIAALRCDTVPRLGETVIVARADAPNLHLEVLRVVHYAGLLDDSDEVEVRRIDVFVQEIEYKE